MNIFDLNKKGKYKSEFIWVDKKGRIQIQIRVIGLVFANTNTNTYMNICHTLDDRVCSYDLHDRV